MNLQTILKAVVTSTLCIQLIACGGGTDGSVHTETPNKLNESSDSALTATERTEAVELVGESVGETIDVTEQAVDGESPRERKMSGKVSDPFDTQSNSYIVAVYYTEPNFAGGYHIHWANNDTLTGTLTANHKIRSYIRRPNCELKFNPPPGKSGAPDVIKSNDFATYNKDFNGLGSVNPTTISRNCSSNRDAYGILFTGKNYTGSALPIFYDGWNRTQLKGDLSKFANAQSFAYNQTNYFKGTNGKSDMADGINFLVGSTTSSVGSSITLSSDLVDLVARPFADIVLEAQRVINPLPATKHLAVRDPGQWAAIFGALPCGLRKHASLLGDCQSCAG
jgi:hypothetical protein